MVYGFEIHREDRAYGILPRSPYTCEPLSQPCGNRPRPIILDSNKAGDEVAGKEINTFQRFLSAMIDPTKVSISVRKKWPMLTYLLKIREIWDYSVCFFQRQRI